MERVTLDKYAIFGNPVAHSMSPSLHTFFAKETSQALEYTRILVPEGGFAQEADRFFADGGKGCNITVPCKTDAFNYADELSDFARAAGAVNTLKKLDDGRIYGDNTDGRGLVYDLNRLGCALFDKKVLILGAGGAARGITLPILNEHPESVCIVNRTVSKAETIARGYEGRVQAAGYESLDDHYDVIINATSTSLSGELPPLSDELIRGASFVYDLMYKVNGLTEFTKKAQKLGVKSVSDGFGMLIGQAVLSFALWRGVTPDFDRALEEFRAC